MLKEENWIWKQQTWVWGGLYFSSFVWASVSSLANGHSLSISWISGGAMDGEKHGAQVRFPEAEEIRRPGGGVGPRRLGCLRAPAPGSDSKK